MQFQEGHFLPTKPVIALITKLNLKNISASSDGKEEEFYNQTKGSIKGSFKEYF